MEFYIHYSNVLAMDFFQLAKVLLFCGIGPKNICVLNEPLIHESDMNASQLFGHKFFWLIMDMSKKMFIKFCFVNALHYFTTFAVFPYQGSIS